ncbi:hypothetical protein Tco_1403778 [Tanacetum coccineum]
MLAPSGRGTEDFKKEVEFEVELHGSRFKPTVVPHTRENPWNEDEEPQQQNMDNYVLVRDIAKRTRSREEDDMAAYAFAIAEEENAREPITLQEAINSSEKDEWVCAMEEEMCFFKKNHTWELVDQPPGQRLMAFSHGNLEETIYMRQLLGFKEGTSNKSKIEYTKGLLRKEFDMKEPGLARKILVMEIVRDRDSQTLSTLHFLKVPKNNLEVLKVLENSLEVLKVLEINVESLKLHEN